MWTMVQHFLHILDLILIMHQLRVLMHPRDLLRRSQINLKNSDCLTLTVGMRLNRGLPRINTIMNPTYLGFHLLNLKNMLIRVDIKPGPDMCRLPQRSICPLHPDTGLQCPLGLSPLGLSLTKTNLNMIQTPPPYYREVALADVPSQYAEEVDTFRSILCLPDPRESMPKSSTSVMGSRR